MKVDFNLDDPAPAVVIVDEPHVETPPVPEPPVANEEPEVVDPPVTVDKPAPPVFEPPIVPPTAAPQPTPADCPEDFSEPEPAIDITTVGDQFFIETFDSGSVSEFWTEYAPLAPTQFVGPEGDRELQVSHTTNEDRIVLRRELDDFDSVYASFETTFVSGFQNPWWSLKQARLYHEAGTLSNAGTVDFAIWGLRRDQGESPFISYVYQDTGHGDQVPIDFPAQGEPVRVSFYTEQNTPGEADGRFMIWMDAELVIDDQEAMLRSRAEAETRPTGISFINNYSGGYYHHPTEPFVRNFDDILFLTDPELAPELVHELALDHFSA